jgi:hypothetical protein
MSCPETGSVGTVKPHPYLVCERCRTRGAELLVVGELEGRAVWICRQCRNLRRPVVLT